MKARIDWPIVFVLTTASLLGVVCYQRSWIPFYVEAEPLYSTVEEFGRELLEQKSGAQVSPSEMRDLISDPRYQKIRGYGVVFSDDPTLIFSLRVNKRFTFEVSNDGSPNWKKTVR